MHVEEKTTNSRVFSSQHSSRFLHLCFQNFFCCSLSLESVFILVQNINTYTKMEPRSPMDFKLQQGVPQSSTCLMFCHCLSYYLFFIAYDDHMADSYSLLGRTNIAIRRHFYISGSYSSVLSLISQFIIRQILHFIPE